MAEDSLAILPSSMGRQPPPGGNQPKKPDPSKFIPREKGAPLLADPKEEECPYTFSDSPAYVRNKKAEEQAKRAAELESKDETRGFLRNVEELAKKQKWDEAFHVMERRTAVPSGLFLVTRAALRWKFGKLCEALRDADEALEKYASSAKAGPLAAALACFFRICLGSEVREKGSCGRELRDLIEAWEQAEQRALSKHALGQGLFHPRQEERLKEPVLVTEGMEACDETYVAAPGVRVGYVFLKNQKDALAPLIVHFHGNMETAAAYRAPGLAQKYGDLPAHLLVADYRGYGWSGGEPSLATFLHDAEALAEKLPEILFQHGLPWPYPGGLILSGRSLGAQAAVHAAALYPNLFRGLVLDSAAATSATGDRLGRAAERGAALERWRKDLEKANLEILQPLDADLHCLSALEKIHAFGGPLLVLHGMEDELVPHEGSESLHAAAGTRQKELVLIEQAGHNNIGQFEEYWTAIRRFCLRVQLDDTLPSVGAAVEHLCAVCAEKAASKCGRCQKVWYCGRAHQAEHWKSHKVTCAGGPPPAKEKVVPEGDACVAAFLFADVRGEDALRDLAASLASLSAQAEPLAALCVSWRCPSRALAARVEASLAGFAAGPAAPKVAAVEAARPVGPFERARELLAAMPEGVPAHAWVRVLEAGELWSSRHVAALLPALRRAAPDPRVVAVRCARLARPGASAEAEAATRPGSAADVEALLAAGGAEVSSAEGPEGSLAGLALRVAPLRAFVEGTPPAALAHPACAHRFECKLLKAFGNKVQQFCPPEGEWLRWAAAPPAAAQAAAEADAAEAEAAEAAETADAEAADAAEADGRRAEFLRGCVRQLQQQQQPPSADDAPASAPSSAPPSAPPPAANDAPPPSADDAADASAAARRPLASAEGAAAAVATLRGRMERRLIVCAGEEMAAKELKQASNEVMGAFLEDVGLREVVGIERWARETAEDLARSAARRLAVKVVTQ